MLVALLADYIAKPVIQMLSRLAATGRRADRFLRSCICSILLFPGILDAQEDEEGDAPYQDPDARNHWAYRPVERAKIPADVPPEWRANPIDAFLWKRLSQDGLKPSPPLGRAALYRRLHYGVTGLPPSPEAVSAFVSDDSPEAYGKEIGRAHV